MTPLRTVTHWARVVAIVVVVLFALYVWLPGVVQDWWHTPPPPIFEY